MYGRRQGSIAWTVITVLGSVVLLGWMALATPSFIAMTKAHGPLMAYAKFFFLGTLGTTLAVGLIKKDWTVAHGIEQAIVWGFFGIWIGMAFIYAAGGVGALIAKHWWFSGPKLWVAFSTSLWINVLGGYAYTMMVSHKWTDHLIMNRWRGLFGLTDFADSVDPRVVVAFLWKTIWFFWLWAHTITFLLPEEWRVIFGAVLSVALGLLLAWKKRAAAQSFR